MVCYFPLNGWRALNGKGIVFNFKQGYPDKPMQVPCGQCIGCRLERSRQWAVRCVHEASLWDSNSFITLTYNDANLPYSGSLVPEDYVLFMKRLRKRFSDSKIRFFHCGEYGSKLDRPHHHACLFNFDFPDKTLYTIRSDVRLYRSSILESLWGKGYCTVGDVTFESAAYVARYVTKKITGEKAFDHYANVDLETGEYFGHRIPEYVTMSRGGSCKGENLGGIGKRWIERFKSDVYPGDFVVIRNGLKVKPPRYYDSIYDEVLTGDIKSVKLSRRVNANLRKEDNSSSRLEVRRICKEAQLNQLKRSFEND